VEIDRTLEAATRRKVAETTGLTGYDVPSGGGISEL
jgi:ADP-ribose pyrophosphatase YjhB (NUDIX family)